MFNESSVKTFILLQEHDFEFDICDDAAILLRKEIANLPLPGQNSRHFADVIFRCAFINENFVF